MILEVESLEVRYGDVTAVRGVDLAVEAGTALAVLGRNGAGKSSTLRGIAGATMPSGGAVRVDGVDVAGRRADDRVRHGIVLVPEGRVVISGLNPTSLWSMRQRRAHFYRRLGYNGLFLPDAGEFIGYWRLRDWLRLLSFEVESGRFGCYRPALTSQKWLARFDWMDKAGARWWPIFGAVYFLVAVKRTQGVRLLEPAWKSRKAVAAAPAAVANKELAPNATTDLLMTRRGPETKNNP